MRLPKTPQLRPKLGQCQCVHLPGVALQHHQQTSLTLISLDLPVSKPSQNLKTFVQNHESSQYLACLVLSAPLATTQPLFRIRCVTPR